MTIFLALCVGAVVAKSTCSGSTCPDAAKGGNLLQAKRSTVLTQNEGSAFDPEVPHGGPEICFILILYRVGTMGSFLF